MTLARSKPIANVVLGKADLARVFALLQNQAAACDPPTFSPTITIVSDDGTITQTDDPTILDDDVVDQHRSRRIEIRYSDHRAHKVCVTLEEETRGSWQKSAFIVSGEEAVWVDATFAELDRLFATARPQSQLFARLRWVIIVPAAIAIAYSWTVLLSRSIHLLLPGGRGSAAPTAAIARFFGEHRLLLYEIFLILFCLPWLVLARSLVGWVEQLWPRVEFDFGPGRRDRNRRVRFRLAVIAVLLVLPIAIALVNGRVFDLS